MTSFSFVLANIVLLLKSIIFCQPFTQKSLQGQDSLPFTFYDFLGYFVPGSFFFICVFYLFQNSNFLIQLKSFSEETSVMGYTTFVIISYINGHLLSYLSSISVELYSIWTLDYPSRYLLGRADNGFWHKLFKKSTSDNLFQYVLRIILKLIMILLIFPVVLTDLFFRKICSSHRLLGKPLDPLSQRLIQTHIVNYYNEYFHYPHSINTKISTEGNDYFNIIYHYVLENCPQHTNKLQNYVTLYGFTRTLCFSIICVIWAYVLNAISATNGFCELLTITVVSKILVFTLIASLLYLSFNKFYRRFTTEVFYSLLSQIKLQ